ncbi:MAG: abortive infection family protein [Gemmatimonadota bacterium]|nr:abortive infection family protein [Gemmatimonadota bacterium]
MDTPAPPQLFVMHGARAAMTAGLTHIEQRIKGIEQAVVVDPDVDNPSVDNPGLAFDLAKALIEDTCKAVLDDLAIPYKKRDPLPKLFDSVKKNLPFLPATASTENEVSRSLDKTLKGLSTAVQGICELRNQCTYASHGSGSPSPAMHNTQALLAAEAADAIVGFLYRMHRQNQTPPPAEMPSFEENSTFNEYLDETCGSIQIYEVVFRASEILFSLDEKAYHNYLAEFDGD